MRSACWKTKDTDTHTEYVTLIAFSRQQWLRERASMLRYTVYFLCVHYFSALLTEVSVSRTASNRKCTIYLGKNKRPQTHKHQYQHCTYVLSLCQIGPLGPRNALFGILRF
jgi:hypothetical protein